MKNTHTVSTVGQRLDKYREWPNSSFTHLNEHCQVVNGGQFEHILQFIYLANKQHGAQ